MKGDKPDAPHYPFREAHILNFAISIWFAGERQPAVRFVTRGLCGGLSRTGRRRPLDCWANRVESATHRDSLGG